MRSLVVLSIMATLSVWTSWAQEAAGTDVGEERGLRLGTFYVSNVERYLWDQGENGLVFYANVALLPRNPGSLFIRSVTADISRRLGIPIPEGSENWRTFLFEIDPDLDGVREGGIAGYRDLFMPR